MRPHQIEMTAHRRANQSVAASFKSQVSHALPTFLKDKQMRNIAKKKSWPLAVAYGIKPEDVIPVATHVDSCTSVNFGWIQLHFGWDEKWCEVLYAITEKDTFLLSAATKTSRVFTGPAKTCDWVYAIDPITNDFIGGVTKRPILVEYAGFYVLLGVDSEGREFVYVAMPNGELNILIRNPASLSTNAWAPRRAVAFDDSMAIDPYADARNLELRMKSEFAFDDELEALLKAEDERERRHK